MVARQQQRQGAEQGSVTAVFDLPGDHAAHGVLEAAGIVAEDGELILRRVNAVDGRKTAWVNDRRVSGEVLRAVLDLSDGRRPGRQVGAR